jgi:glycosyltransferase involved in cell wall biosynthesis
VPAWKRTTMLPLVAHVMPGLARYAYGRSRPMAAELVARSVAPVIAHEARGADVIHMWAGDLLASAVIRAGELARVPVVITPFAHEGQWGYDRASVLAYQRADRVAALLETEATFYAGLGVAKHRIEVAGVCSPGVPALSRDEARQQLGVSGPLVLFLGARRPYKGFDLLLEAAPRVNAAHPAATFAFVGPGERLQNVPAGSRVLDVGAVEEHEKALWLSAADLLCLPSQAEILPVSILEAWSAGIPVLTSDIPALRELVGRAGGGRCVARSADALARGLIEMLSSPDQLRALGALGHRTWQTRYTPSAVAASHEAMYLDLDPRPAGTESDAEPEGRKAANRQQYV